MNIFFLLALGFSFAFAQDMASIDKMIEEHSVLAQKGETHQNELSAEIKVLEKDLVNLKQERTELTDRKNNLNSNVVKVKNEIRNALKELPLRYKISKLSRFYRCLLDKFEVRGVMELSRCEGEVNVHLDVSQRQKVYEWSKKAGFTEEEIQLQIDTVERNIGFKESTMLSKKESFDFWTAETPKLKANIEELKNKKNEILKETEFLIKNKNYLNCDATSPTINLEEQVPFPGAEMAGPFYNIPRDNQDGLGTCYANAAKNLLVGISGGQINASFLDMALQDSRDKTTGELKTDIDGGSACEVLDSIKKYGYCPKELSPVETGEANLLMQGLLAKGATDLQTQSSIINGLGKFFNDKTTFELNGVRPAMLQQLYSMAQDIKNNPDVILPVPVLRFDVPGFHKLKEVYVWGIKKNEKFNKNEGLTEETFVIEYQNYYQNFKPFYAKAVLEGKSASEVFSIYKEKMKPFIEKYELEDNLESMWYSYNSDVEKDYALPELAKRVKASIQFLRKYIPSQSKDDEAFLKECLNDKSDSFKFINSFQDLLTHLKTEGVDSKQLFDTQGNLKKTEELMQLAIAPACLNDANRRQIRTEFSCVNIGKTNFTTNDEKRKSIVLSLLQGYPLGNTFEAFSGGWHINTIVGMRFNPILGRCELLIRESQTGMSSWNDEQGILNRMSSLTEVRRK